MIVIPNLQALMGNIYTVSLGVVLHWYYLALVCSLPPIVLLVCSIFMPESPSILVVKGHKQKAMKILLKLRGPYANIQQEVADLEMLNSETRNGWQDLFKIHVLKRLIGVLTLFVFQHLCGQYLFLVYTSRVLRATGTPMDINSATVIISVLRLLGSLTAMAYVDRIGRRSCLIISYAITAMTLVILGTFVHLVQEPSSEGSVTHLRYTHPMG